MIRILTVALAFFAISILLASGWATLFPNEETLQPTSDVNEKIGLNTSQSRENSQGVRPNIPRNLGSSSAVFSNSKLDKSASSLQALEDQVSNQLAGYVSQLDTDESRSAVVLAALSQAYKDAAALAATTDASSTQNQDPNYVVNAMAEFLDAQELLELELYLETSSKDQFLTTYGPQIDLLSSTLSTSGRELLLETYFAEHYAATNPHGSLAPQNSMDFVSKQLEAIEVTREQLRSGLDVADFTIADAFLSAQAAGLEMAQNLFSPRN